jgi:hypothetical protein
MLEPSFRQGNSWKTLMRHYVNDPSINARSQKGRRLIGKARRCLMSSKRFTYRQLLHLVTKRPPEEVDPTTHPHLAAELPSPTSNANLESALRSFLEERQIDWDEEIRRTLRSEFTHTVRAHINALRGQERNPSYIKNRKHLLTRWHKILRALDHDRASVIGNLTPLQEALKKLIGSTSVRSVAIAAHIPVASLRRWIDGQIPQRSKVFYLSRLEEHFHLESGELVNLFPMRIGLPNSTPGLESAPRNEYRAGLSRKVKEPFRMTPKVTPAHIREDWIGLMRHKSGLGRALSSVSGLTTNSTLSRVLKKGDPRITWRTREADPFEVQNGNSWPYILDGVWVPTAGIRFNDLAAYMGWAMQPPEKGGCGMRPDELTLGMFADKTLLMRYLDWHIEHTGKIHGGPIVFLHFVASLCHPVTGYLVTRRELGDRFGCSTTEAWKKYLTEVKEWLRKEIEPKIAAEQRLSGRSRDQEKVIGDILAMARPLDALAEVVKRLERRLSKANGLEELRAARDVMLVALLMSNPLRALNLKRMRYLADNSGHLRRTPEGGWKLFIPRREFKNIHGAAKNRDYDMEIDPAVWPFITRYLKTYRPMFGTERPELVFVSEKNRAREWKGLNKRFRGLTKSLIPRCDGFGPHCVRDIYATQVIKQSKGDYIAAAEALHDDAETVKRSYWHLINRYADSARRAAVQGSMAIFGGEPSSPTV